MQYETLIEQTLLPFAITTRHYNKKFVTSSSFSGFCWWREFSRILYRFPSELTSQSCFTVLRWVHSEISFENVLFRRVIVKEWKEFYGNKLIEIDEIRNYQITICYSQIISNTKNILAFISLRTKRWWSENECSIGRSLNMETLAIARQFSWKTLMDFSRSGGAQGPRSMNKSDS